MISPNLVMKEAKLILEEKFDSAYAKQQGE
jgi:hypothetical protein